MANRRMFSKEITNTDSFQSMKLSAQALYFHLGMNADDDGFVGNPLSITKAIEASSKDLERLVENGFLLPFRGGVYLITDWLINNHIRRDRYNPTVHQEFKRMVGLDENGRYALGIPLDIPVVDPDKDSIG